MSDAGRERAIDVLKAAFAEGRLTRDEHAERAGRAHGSRTYAELAAASGDQYPLSGRPPVPRRRALAGWARANGALIAEDDCDGGSRYDVAALPALFGLDPEVVIYLGSTTKTLTPR